MMEPIRGSEVDLPRVTVLLATHNGIRWLPEQLQSIIDQSDIELTIVALDDGSTDGTRDWLLAQARMIGRKIRVLPVMEPSGGSAANFFRLLTLVYADTDSYIAFADQDDIWVQGKLARHIALLRNGVHDGVSSNITAFSPRGRRTLIRKNFPQRKFDYVTESPGPGSTFVITSRLATLVAEQLGDPESPAASADFHDSLIYAIGRSAGLSWHIDEMSTVDYRQHDDNVMGSNVGLRSALARLNMIRSRWHRSQALVHASAGIRVAQGQIRDDLEHLVDLLLGRGLRNRLALARMAPQLRRRPRDQWIIGFLIAIGIW
jgi:rhamnosyltransferase